MKLRLAAPVAAAALLFASAPLAAAQTDSLDTSSLPSTESLQGEEGEESPLASLGELGLDDIKIGSVDLTGVLTPKEEGVVCELPSFAGSVFGFLPTVAGMAGVPSPVTMVAGSLLRSESLVGSADGATGSVPNPLELVGGAGLLESAGSLEGPLCGVLGGEMADPNAPEETPADGAGSIDAGSIPGSSGDSGSSVPGSGDGGSGS